MTGQFQLAGSSVWVAGHRGMVGQALVRRLEHENVHLLTADRQALDLLRQVQVERYLDANRPDVVFVAAAKVGGIGANSQKPAEFLYENLMIEANIIHAAYRSGIRKLIFMGSSCIYPKLAPQPIPESALLTGALEPTNEWYAVAKIAGIKLCQAYRRQYGCDFISAQPTNLYGPGDNFDLASSHVLPALMRKADDARKAGAESLPVWGTGSAMREFLHVDDLADALVFLARTYSDEAIVNVGTGEEITIAALARKICDVVGFAGGLAFDPTQPDGTPRKVVDLTRLHGMGWRHQVGLDAGLASTYAWFQHQSGKARGMASTS